MLTLQEIDQFLRSQFENIVLKSAYAEDTYFYNKNLILPHGVYFVSIKQNDGPNDKASALDRSGVFRLSFKPHEQTYVQFFGQKPPRPKKGEFTPSSLAPDELNLWQPHPVYAWMGWTMILNPNLDALESLRPYLKESYEQAKALFEQKTRLV